MVRKPLKSTRPLYKYETTPVGERTGDDGMTIVGTVPTVLGITAQTLTDNITVVCKNRLCRRTTTEDRLVKARAWMRDHFLSHETLDQRGHNKFSLKCTTNLSRRYVYRDENKVEEWGDDNYWQRVR